MTRSWFMRGALMALAVVTLTTGVTQLRTLEHWATFLAAMVFLTLVLYIGLRVFRSEERLFLHPEGMPALGGKITRQERKRMKKADHHDLDEALKVLIEQMRHDGQLPECHNYHFRPPSR